MQGHTLDPAQLDTVYRLAAGSIGQALACIGQEGLDILAQILDLFEQYPHWVWPDIHIFADRLAGTGRSQSYQSFTTLLLWIFSQMVTAKARRQRIEAAALHTEAMEALHGQSSLESLLKICENLKSHFSRVEHSNLDKRQAVLGAFSIIAA